MRGIEGDVSTLRLGPSDAIALLVLAHGAGAGMDHAFMKAIARRLAERGVATFRYRFPYMEGSGWPPDRPPVLEATVRAAVTAAAASGLPLFAGGKSLGGRMTSRAAAAKPLPEVRGIVFLGFPLHPKGKPGTVRADHLADVDAPMLFVQGDRDGLADLDLLRLVVERLGSRATIRVVEGADHGFHVLKRSGRTDDEVLDEVADAIAAWVRCRVDPGGAGEEDS